jgi:N4-gp56 family major capsid protein
MPNLSTVFTNDQNRWVGDKLISRSMLIHKFPQLCEDVELEDGNGKTANFILYNRTDIPQTPLSEGVTPVETPMTISTVSVTMDQWGLYITLTDVGLFTTKHPLLNAAIELLADAIARVQDYTIADVFNFGSTNKQFWDGTRADRSAITATDVFKKEVFLKAAVTLRNSGAGERNGDFFIAVCDPNVEADIVNETNGSSFTGYSLLQSHSGKVEKVEKGTAGAWLGFQIIRTNFIPVFTRITTVTSANFVGGTGGALASSTNHFIKVVRRSKQRGFGEGMTVEITKATGAGETRLTFTAPSTSGFSYDVYIGTTTGDSNLRLYVQGVDPSGVVNIDSVPTSGDVAPTTPASGVSVHPIYMMGKEAANWVKASPLTQKGLVTQPSPSDSDPLVQRRKVGSKYMAKAGIRRQAALLIVELASNFN